MARSNNHKAGSKAREAKAPAFIAWHVAEKSDSKSFWTRIGAAWEHEDGKGFTADIVLVPVGSGRIVFRTPNEATEEKGA